MRQVRLHLQLNMKSLPGVDDGAKFIALLDSLDWLPFVWTLIKNRTALLVCVIVDADYPLPEETLLRVGKHMDRPAALSG